MCFLLAVAVSRGQAILPPAVPVAPEYQAPEDPRELLRSDDAMRDFFAQRLSRRSSGYHRLSEIVDLILKPEGLDFAYDPQGTFDARETFRRRRGNCASFAFLVVAVTREFGFDASFQTVERPARWDRVGGMVVSVLHLGVRVITHQGTYVVDLEPYVVPPRRPNPMQVVADETACAQFYGNIGFQHLVAGRTDLALRYMTLATKVDPGCASAWANCATLQSRLGHLAEAEAGFRRSLKADPHGEAALDGFVAVLRRLGGEDDLREADRLERRARRIRERNPYYQQELARLAHERGDIVEAERRVRRAIALHRDEPDFYVEWVAVLNELGRTDDARRAARELDRVRDRLASLPIHVRP